MMRPLPHGRRCGRSGVSYPVGRVVAHQNINYRVRVAHTSVAAEPAARPAFDRWERVNNNDGSLAAADHLRGRRPGAAQRPAVQGALGAPGADGQTPPANPALWDALPMTACGQLAEFCADDTGNPTGAGCLATRTGGRGGHLPDAAQDLPARLRVDARRTVLGLCNNPITFTVPDGANFQSGNLGTGATCHETTSEISRAAASASQPAAADRQRQADAVQRQLDRAAAPAEHGLLHPDDRGQQFVRGVHRVLRNLARGNSASSRPAYRRVPRCSGNRTPKWIFVPGAWSRPSRKFR